jgi:hypothetical protein
MCCGINHSGKKERSIAKSESTEIIKKIRGRESSSVIDANSFRSITIAK